MEAICIETICRPFSPKDYGCPLDFYDDYYISVHQRQSVCKLEQYLSSRSSNPNSICESSSKEELSRGLFLLVQQYIFNLPLATAIGRYVDIDIQDEDGNTLLHLARTSAAIKFLLDLDINPNVRNKQNQTALDTMVDSSVNNYNWQILVSYGYMTSRQLEDYYIDKIIDSFLYERMDKLEKYLPKLLPGTINDRCLLNQCCEMDSVTRFDMASLLLTHGADPDICSVTQDNVNGSNGINCLNIILTQEFDPQLANILFLHSKEGLHQSISNSIYQDDITNPEAISWLGSMGLD